MNHALFLAAILFLAGASTGAAHFADNYVVRSFLATSDDTGVVVYQRVPVPLLFADRLQDINALPRNDPDQILFAVPGSGVMLSGAAIAKAPDAFAARLLNHATWRGPDGPLTPTLAGWRIDPTRLAQDLRSADEAEAALARPGVDTAVNMATATVEFALRFDVPPDTRLHVTTALPPLLLRPGLQLENHVTDLRQTPPRSFSVPGQMETPIAISPSVIEIFGQFVYQGMVHVFGGLDHVLLIVCVTLGTLALRPLLIALTGFTLGHSVTLILGFLGITAPGSVFIILVEAAVAATVGFAAIQALRKRRAHPLSLVLVGLLHGFGFSFVLRNILGQDSPDLIPALLAFNVGIEIAQIIIVVVVLTLSWSIRRESERAFRLASAMVLVGSLAVAGLWCFERLASLFPGV